MSAQYSKVTVSPTKEKIQFESPNLSVMKNVTTTVSIVTVTTSESKVLSAGSCPLEATTLLPSNGTTVPSKVTTTHSGSRTVPPKGTTESTVVNVNPPRPEVSVPSVESVSSDILESTEIVPLEVTSSSETTIESVPPPPELSPEQSVASVDSVLLLSTDDVTSDSIESIIPVAETIFGSTESAPLDVTCDQSIESHLPLNGTTSSSSLTSSSVPVESIVESTESSSVHLEYSTSESAAESVPSTDQSTTDPSVVTKPTEGVAPPRPPESAVEGVVPPDSSSTGGSAPSKVTDASTENSNPPQSTTAANVGTAPSPGLTVASSLTCGADDQDQQLRAKARDDAINLNRAFEGFGCDAATIVNILSKRSATNRILIKEEYKAKFSEDFDNRLSKELTFKPDLKRAVLLWMDEPACRDAKLVKHGLSTQINVAIEVICSRTPSQIEQLKMAYRKMFGVYLLEDIESHAHCDHKKLLLEYARNQRLESPEVDEMKVDEDAKILFRDGEWKPGTNEETFIRILSERSSAHLTALNFAYRTMYVNSLKKAVKKETLFKFKLTLKFALLTILQCAENPAKYFAKALHKAMKGIGTDDETLTRIIVSRAEVDIQQIKAEYEKKYGKALADDVHSDTSKHYRAFLLSLLNFNAA